MRIKSKVDLWIGLLMIVTGLIIVWSIVILPQSGRLLGAVFSLPVIAFLLWMYFGTYYELHDDYLYARSGPFVEQIAYEKIKSLRLARNMYSSMALSAERIEIKQHSKGFVAGTTYISPKNREAFMSLLAMRCKNLV